MLYWQLTKLEVQCEVIAPSLVPVRSDDRVKTDRRDAEKLARALRAATPRRCSFPAPRTRLCDGAGVMRAEEVMEGRSPAEGNMEEQNAPCPFGTRA